MEIHHFLILALVKLINGQRGREFISSLLRGSRSKKVGYLVRKNDLWGFYNLFSLLTKSDLTNIFEELLTAKLIEIREERASDGFVYPFVYVTTKGKESLEQYIDNSGPQLYELLMGNKRLAELQAYLLEKASKTRAGASSIERIREEYPRAYEKWSEVEIEKLESEFRRGRSLSELARLLQRRPGAIQSRLIRLGFTIEQNKM